MSPMSSSGALCAAKCPPRSNIVQRTMLAWSRSANRRIPLKSPPNPASASGSVVGPVGRSVDVGVLVVQPGRGRCRAGQPVQHHVRDREVRIEVLAQQLAVPGEQAERRVADRVAEGLRLLRHQRVERHLVLDEPLERAELALLLLGHAGELRRVARGEGEDLGDVHADDVLGVEPADFRRDHRTGVVADGPVALVAEAAHEFDPRRGDPVDVPAGLAGRAGEAVAGDRGDDEVEGDGGVAAVRAWVAQRTDHVEKLDDRPGPAVGDDERERVRLG